MTATSGDGQTGTATISYTVAGTPGAAIATPQDGATYNVGQTVNANYTCSSDQSDPIFSCTDSQGVGDGNPIQTVAPGVYRFTVTATDALGQTGTQTVTYKVAGPPSASISAPANGSSFAQGASVPTSFSCTDGTDGPGIASCADGNGATDGTGSLATATVGTFTYTVKAISTDGQTATMSIHYTVVGPPASTKAPTITGSAVGAAKLTGNGGKFTGNGTLSYTRQWLRCAAAAGSCAPISGATASTYVLTPSDVGHMIAYRVTATDALGQSASATSAAVGPVTVPSAPVNTAAPTITGTAQPGKTLKLQKGSWTSPDPIAYSYQWQRRNASGGGCVAMPGVTGTSYRVNTADVGHEITATVTATDQTYAQRSQATATPVGPIIG